MNIVFVRASPIMEVFTGILIAILIYLSANLIAKNELEIGNFFSFLAAMMLAYQPIRSLATLNIAIQMGVSAARRVLPIIDNIPEIQDKENCKELILKNGEINFNNVNFNYSDDGLKILITFYKTSILFKKI